MTRKEKNVDEIFKDVGEIGVYQIKVILLAGWILISLSSTTYQTVFIDATPDFRCELSNSTFSNDTYKNQSIDHQLLIDRHFPTDNTCSIQSSSNQTAKCVSYVYSKEFYERTIITDWNLVCDNIHYKSLIKTMHFVGGLTIFVTGILGDRIGRKKTAYILIILYSLASALSAITFNFITNQRLAIIALLISRFFMGVCDNLYSLVNILVLEIIGPTYRLRVASFMFSIYVIGEFILALCAYLLRDYKKLSVCLAFLNLIAVLYFWWFPESIRYLAQKKKFKEVDAIYKKIAKSNKKKYTPNYNEDEAENEELIEKKKEVTLSVLFRKEVFSKFLVTLVNWFANGLIYFGIGTNTDVIGGNPYHNFVYLAIVELAALMVFNSVISRFGRKKPYVIMFCLVIVSFVTIGFIPKYMNWLLIILVVIGKFSITFTFSLIWLVSAESFPTKIRTRALSICALVARIATIFSPSVHSLGTIYMKSLPYMIYAFIALVSTILYSIFMPETSGEDLPETLDDLVKKKTKSNDLELDC